MAAGTRRHGDQPIDSLLYGLARVAHRRDVVEHEATVAVDRLDHRRRGLQARDHDRYAMPRADFEVGRQPRVAVVDDQIHRVWRRAARRGASGGFDVRQPFVQQIRRSCIEGWKGADDSGAALRDDQFRR